MPAVDERGKETQKKTIVCEAPALVWGLKRSNDTFCMLHTYLLYARAAAKVVICERAKRNNFAATDSLLSPEHILLLLLLLANYKTYIRTRAPLAYPII